MFALDGEIYIWNEKYLRTVSHCETTCAIQWIVTYSVDSVIHFLKNWGQLEAGRSK